MQRLQRRGVYDNFQKKMASCPSVGQRKSDAACDSWCHGYVSYGRYDKSATFVDPSTIAFVNQPLFTLVRGSYFFVCDITSDTNTLSLALSLNEGFFRSFNCKNSVSCLEAYQRARKRMNLARESVPNQIRSAAVKVAQDKLKRTTDEEKIKAALAKTKTE